MSTCNKNHRYEEKFNSLPHDQGGDGRHKCSGWCRRILQIKCQFDILNLVFI